MLIRMLANADGTVDGKRKALFAGQTYDADDAADLIGNGLAEAVGGAKAVHSPPEDKALSPVEDKVIKRRGRPPKNR